MRPIVEIYFYPRPPRGGRHNSLNGWATDIKFLSTPSARRATKRVTQKGGDRRFLSTPSARRATSRRAIRSLMGAYFYPRPPRGGRPTRAAATDSTEPISIHALREEGDCRPWTGGSCRYDFYPCPPRGGRLGGILYGGRGQGISIHALREEGDSPYRPRRALRTNFYPRPPRGGRLFGRLKQRRKKPISIHALREEGDDLDGSSSEAKVISIHALREEGDHSHQHGFSLLHDFYPRPPRGGRQQKQRQNLYFQTNYTTFCTNLEEP